MKREKLLPKSILATLLVLADELGECKESEERSREDCGWIHAYALTSKLELSYMTVRLALEALFRMGAVERRQRIVDGRLRIEYRLTPQGYDLALQQAREVIRKRLTKGQVDKSAERSRRMDVAELDVRVLKLPTSR